MASKSDVLLMEETQLCAVLNQPQPVHPEVLSTIYTAHYRHVLQICRRFFRQPEEAEDAAAEVFLKLYRVLHQKDETLPFRPWVSQVAGHHCIDKLRRKKFERSSFLEEIDLSTVADRSTPSPLSQILRKDEQRQVREQLTRLPDKYKVPLVLRYYKRMSYSEIARELNTRLPAVRMTIFRAKDYLRRNLRRSEKAQRLGLGKTGLKQVS
ncbi:MAG: sigma-70 family RNA polymerase sigma factor [Candidatus Acidiferrum sp.]